MAFLKDDKDYEDLGVAPPERNPHGIAGDDNQSVIDAINAAGHHKHKWYCGDEPYLECSQGHHIHGRAYDHLNYILVGTDANGEPILKKLDFK